MKKSLSKKILAMFLAAVMLVTAVPFVAFADDGLDAIDAAITAYETKVSTSNKIYKNMGNAYLAYITAKEIRDSYMFGGNKVLNLAGYAKTLTDATDAMGTGFVFRTSNDLRKKEYISWKNSFDTANDINVSRNVTKNVLYADTFSNEGDEAAAGLTHEASNGQNPYGVKVYYGNSVMLYDGVTTPSIPVLASVQIRAWWGQDYFLNNHRWYHAMYALFPKAYGQTVTSTNVPNNSDFRIWDSSWPGSKEGEIKSQSWRAKNGTDWQSSLAYHWWTISGNDSRFANLFNDSNPMFPGYGIDINNKPPFGDSNGNPVGMYVDKGTVNLLANHVLYNEDGTPRAPWFYYASTLQYKNANGWEINGNLDSGSYENAYVKSVQIPWGDHLNHFGQKGETHSFGNGTATTATNVINYKAITDLYNKVLNSQPLKSVDKYDQNRNDINAFMEGIDNLTYVIENIDNEDFYNKEGVSNAVSQISNKLVTADAAINKCLDPDFGPQDTDHQFSYRDLRNELTEASKILAGGQKLYTDESWNNFYDAYVDPYYHFNHLGTLEHYRENLAGMYEGGYAKILNDARMALEEYDACKYSDYDYTRRQLKAALALGTSTKASVEAVQNFLEVENNLKYWYNEDADWRKIPETMNGDIEAERLLLEAAIAMLESADTYKDTYNQVLEGIATLNADAINLDEVNKVVEAANEQLVTPVEVLGVKYDSIDYDGATDKILHAVNTERYEYTVMYTDSDLNTYYLQNDGQFYQVGWGSSDEEEIQSGIDYLLENGFMGYFHYNDVVEVTDPNVYSSYPELNNNFYWTLSVSANKTQVQQKPMFIGEGDTVKFVVRGNTKLQSSTVFFGDTARITFVDGRNNNVLDVAYVDSTYDATDMFDIANANIPNYAFHEVASYECDDENIVIEDGVIYGLDWGMDIVVKVNYVPTAQQGVYAVNLVDAYGNSLPMAKNEYHYEERATFAFAGAKSFVRAIDNGDGTYSEGEFLATGNEFKYNIYEDITVMAVADTPEKITVSVVQTPATTEDRTYFHGSFTGVPENATVISGGIVLDRYNKYGKDLSLAKVNNADGVYNLSTEYFRETTQFGATAIGAKLTKPISYVAYVIYKVDGEDLARIAYSEVVTDCTVEY